MLVATAQCAPVECTARDLRLFFFFFRRRPPVPPAPVPTPTHTRVRMPIHDYDALPATDSQTAPVGVLPPVAKCEFFNAGGSVKDRIARRVRVVFIEGGEDE